MWPPARAAPPPPGVKPGWGWPRRGRALAHEPGADCPKPGAHRGHGAAGLFILTLAKGGMLGAV